MSKALNNTHNVHGYKARVQQCRRCTLLAYAAITNVATTPY